MNLNPKFNFIIIGTQKGGTTALFEYLKTHPNIVFPKQKELHFFDNENHFKSSPINYNNYEKNIPWSFTKNRVVGEATPIYMYWRPAIKRIFNYNSNIKLIIVLRNPIKRAFSQWNMEYGRGNEKDDFFDAIKKEETLLKTNPTNQNRVLSYIDRGLYAKQIINIKKYFSTNQLLFIKYENFLINQYNTLIEIFDFLEVKSDNYRFKQKVVHKRPYDRKITPEESTYLRNIFYNDIEEVEDLLGWNCNDWKK